MPATLLLAEPAPSASPRPNIIFILADDLGYGDLGCYGQREIRTPNLDELAAEGLRFTQHYAGSTVCAPSRCVLMTGLHTGHARIRANGSVPLQPEDVTVARLLHNAGYRTALIGKWGLGEAGTTGVPTPQGFDYFFGYLNQGHAHNYYPDYLWRNEQKFALKNVMPPYGGVGAGVATKKVQYSHDVLMDEAMGWIDEHVAEPFFLYLALTIPHANNEAGNQGMEVPSDEPYTDKPWPQAQKNHAAMISRMDRDVGRLIAQLKRLGIDERTIVFFSSDNGPHREGGADPEFFDANGPLRGIKRDLYEGGVRVPLLVRWPGTIAPDATSDHICWFADFLPTAWELAGVDRPADIDGISYLPTLVGKSGQAEHSFLYWEFFERGGRQAVRLGDWKGVRLDVRTKSDGPVELYHLPSDPGEQTDVATAHAEIVGKIREIMATARTPSPHWSF